jgi:hypothetical protein
VVENPETVRSQCRENAASASAMPAHNFTIGNNGLSTSTKDDREPGNLGRTSGRKVRKSLDSRKLRTSSNFTDEEGEGGEPDDEVEGV